MARVCVALLALCLVAAAPAEDDELSVTDLVRYVAEKTKHAYLIDASVKRAKIRLIAPGDGGLDALDPATLTKVFHAALDSAGISVVPGDKFSRLVKSGEAKGHDIPVYATPEQLPDDDRRITAMVPLRHMPVDEAVATLKQLLSKEAVVVPDHRSQRLLIVERSKSLRRMLKVLRQLDQPAGEENQLFIIELHNANAADVAGTLEGVSGP